MTNNALEFVGHINALGPPIAANQTPVWLQEVQALAGIATTMGVLIALYIAAIREPRKDAAERSTAKRPDIRAATDALNPANKELAARAAEQVLGQQPGTMPFGPEAYAMHALNGVLAELATGTVEHGGWDIYLPHAAMQSALEYVVKRAWDAPAKSPGSNRHEPRLMRDLLNVELPDPAAQITVADVVNIRRNDEAFSTWRRDLRGALRALNDELADHDDLSADAARKTLAEELHPAMQQVRKQMGRSRFLSAIGAGGVDFSIGAVVEISFHGAEGLGSGALTSLPPPHVPCWSTSGWRGVRPLQAGGRSHATTGCSARRASSSTAGHRC